LFAGSYPFQEFFSNSLGYFPDFFRDDYRTKENLFAYRPLRSESLAKRAGSPAPRRLILRLGGGWQQCGAAQE
jgi:hypothetical protein